MWTFLAFIAVLLAATARPASAADYCTSNTTQGELRMATASSLSPFNTYTSPSAAGTCQTWKLTMTTLLNPDSDCVGSDRWLLLELYLFKRKPGSQDLLLDTSGVPGRIAFLASREFQPAVQFVPNSDSFVPLPPLNSPALESYRGDLQGNGGLFMDEDATGYDRWHHRLLIPNVTNTPNPNDVWWITVSNLDDSDTTLQAYSIRATCFPAAQVPCARPFPNAGSCSLPLSTPPAVVQQTCTQTPQGSDPRNLICQCNGTTGDYGCNRPVTTVSMSGTSTSVSVASNTFQFFRVKVPTNAPGSSVLLAEFQRDSSSSFGADPWLFVKPVNTDDRNTPYWADTDDWADNSDWALLQSYHYILQRDIKATNNDWYVAVGNYRNRFRTESTLKGTLTLRWSTPQQPFMCPQDCSGRGTCQDPRSTPNLPAYGLGDGSAGFVCACPPGYGGLFCDGLLQQVTLSTYSQSISGSVAPGKWSYMLVNIDPRRFSYRSDSMVVNWKSADALGTGPMGQVNAILTLNEDQFPQQGQYVPPGGTNYYLITSYPSAANKLPFELMGNRMRQGASYLIGVYNSEYQRSVVSNYFVEAYTPMPMSSWLHPYMSVVLGITAAIVLCLFMTLCKRMVTRGQWGPFRRGGAAPGSFRDGILGDDGLDANGLPRHAMLQIMPRQQGVPPSIVESFPTFSYTKPPPLASTASATAAATAAHAVPATASAMERAEASRSQREALQAAAAEAATTAAAAVIALRTQQRQQQLQQQDGSGAGDQDRTSAHSAANGNTNPAGTQQQQPGDVEAPGAADWQQQPPVALEHPLASEQTANMAAAAAKAAAAAHHQRHHAQQQQQQQDGGAGDGVVGNASAAPGVGAEVPTILASPLEEAKLPPLPDEDAPACTVCLCEYEQGDLMRRLPCGHEFHRACIDKWMVQHVTCPVCREPLVTAQELQELQQAQQQQGGGGGGGGGGHVAVIYIPQSIRLQTAANINNGGGDDGAGNTPRGGVSGGDTSAGAGAGGPGGVPPAAAQGGMWGSLSRALSRGWQGQLQQQGGAPQQPIGVQLGGGSGRRANHSGVMGGGGGGGGGGMGVAEAGSAAAGGWHVTTAWGSTDAGGDPFASPLPMNGGRRSSNNTGTTANGGGGHRLQRGIGSRGGTSSSRSAVRGASRTQLAAPAPAAAAGDVALTTQPSVGAGAGAERAEVALQPSASGGLVDAGAGAGAGGGSPTARRAMPSVQ